MNNRAINLTKINHKPNNRIELPSKLTELTTFTRSADCQPNCALIIGANFKKFPSSPKNYYSPFRALFSSSFSPPPPFESPSPPFLLHAINNRQLPHHDSALGTSLNKLPARVPSVNRRKASIISRGRFK